MATLDPIALAALPVGTSNAQAFSRNASDIDTFVNGVGIVQSRTGKSLLSLDEALIRIGYETPVAFASGIVVTRATQTIISSGLTYHAKPASLPFTTTGTFLAGQWALVSNITAQDLASTATGKGSELIGILNRGTLLDKLKDLVHAKDFGAADTGTGDESAAEASGLSLSTSLRAIFGSLWMWKFPKRGVKTWKRTFGTFDQAAVLSVTAVGSSDEPKTYITGFTDPSDVSVVDERGSTAIFAQAEAAPPLLVTSATSFTSTTVSSAAIAGVSASVLRGMMVDVAGSPKYTGTITAASGSTITVGAWYRVDGSRATGTPTNGAAITVNPTTKIWAHNANTVLRDTGDAHSSTGFELGLFDLRSAHAGGTTTTWGFDSVNLGNIKGDAAFIARGGGPGWENGFQATSCLYSFTASGFSQAAFRAFEVPGVPFARFVGGSGDWYHLTSLGQVKAPRVSPGIISASVTLTNWGNTSLILSMSSTSQVVTLPSPAEAPGTLVTYICLGQPCSFSGAITSKSTLANVSTLSVIAGQGGTLMSDGSRWVEMMRG